jgi:hypothetical protein
VEAPLPDRYVCLKQPRRRTNGQPDGRAAGRESGLARLHPSGVAGIGLLAAPRHPFAALGLAFWRRSLVWGLAVVNAAILFKIAWTFLFSTEAGAMSHLPAAVLGLVVCDAMILYVIRRMRARSSYERPRPGEHHG